MVTNDWYAVVNEASLEQGDLLLGLPIFRVEADVASTAEEEVVVERETRNVVVLTQTCDIENDKVEDLLVAQLWDYRELVAREGAKNPSLKGKDFRRAAVRGNLPPYSLLPEREEPPALPWTLVDFHHLYSIPKGIAAAFASQGGDRLRLVPPYKEHLAQAFARYIMRVGLPYPLNGFEGYQL